MKSNLRSCAMLTASTFGLLIAAVGCGAQGAEDPLTTEQQAVMSADEEAADQLTTEQQAVMSTDEEAITSDESALIQEGTAQSWYRGRCWHRRNCKGPRLPSLLTRGQCGSRRGHSWRRLSPPGRCVNLPR